MRPAKHVDYRGPAVLRKLQSLGEAGMSVRDLWFWLGEEGDVAAVARLCAELAEAGDAHEVGGVWYAGAGARPRLLTPAHERLTAVQHTDAARPLPPRSTYTGGRPVGAMVGGRFVVGAKAPGGEETASDPQSGSADPLRCVSPCGDLAQPQAVRPTESGGAYNATPAGTTNRTEGEVGVTTPSAAQVEARATSSRGESAARAEGPFDSASPTLSEGSSNGRIAAVSPARADDERNAGSSPAHSTLRGRPPKISKRILEIITERPGLRIAEIHAAMGLQSPSKEHSSALLTYLREKGLARTEGGRQKARWYPVSPGVPGSAPVADVIVGERSAGASSGRGSQTGFDSAPSHYSGAGQLEAIDRIWLMLRASGGDAAMIAFCLGTALKYELRAGKKTEGDPDKARWYLLFAAYVRGEGPDPRTARPGWVPHRDAPRPLNPHRGVPPAQDTSCLTT